LVSRRPGGYAAQDGARLLRAWRRCPRGRRLLPARLLRIPRRHRRHDREQRRNRRVHRQELRRWVLRGRLRRADPVPLQPGPRPGRPAGRRYSLTRSGAAAAEISREPRPRVAKLNPQRIRTIRRFWKPIRYHRWTTSQVTQAMNPLSFTPLTSATAAARPIVARLPLSRYRNGGVSRPESRARTTFAT